MTPSTTLSVALTLFSVALLSAAEAVNAERGIVGASYTVDRLDDVLSADDCSDAVALDCSLRGAIRRSNIDGISSEILLPGGNYFLGLEGANEDSNTTGDLDITAGDVLLAAVPGHHPRIIQLTNDRLFHVHPSAGIVQLVGPLTLTGGDATNAGGSERGGAMYFFRGASLELENISFENSFAADEGGCLAWYRPISPGFLLMNNVSFSGCETEDSGGAFLIESLDSTVVLDEVVVVGNTAGQIGGGGTILAGPTTVQILRSTFENNTAAASFTTDSAGGGLYLDGGTFVIQETTIAWNTAGRPGSNTAEGGGLFAQDAQLVLRNSTLSGNISTAVSSRASELMATTSSTVAFEFSTLAASEGQSAAAIELEDAGSQLDFFGSIVRGSCAGSGAFSSDGLNVENPISGAPASQCELTSPSDVSLAVALLRPLAGYGGPTATHALLSSTASSALIAPAGLCPGIDQRGAPRVDLFCYAGAHEHASDAPGLWVFADGFESGDLAAWSGASP